MGPPRLIPLFTKGHVGWGLPLRRRQHRAELGKSPPPDLEAQAHFYVCNMGVTVKSQT